MADTATQILDVAEDLMQRGGYHAFSFQDIAGRIGIKKASIYYHHPAKDELGRAVVARYRQRFGEVLASLEADTKVPPRRALELYLERIEMLAAVDGYACLCGVLGGEYAALPAAMQAEISGYFGDQIDWLTRLLARGRKSGDFAFSGAPAKQATLIFSAIEGLLLIHRTGREAKEVSAVLSLIKDNLKP